MGDKILFYDKFPLLDIQKFRTKNETTNAKVIKCITTSPPGKNIRKLISQNEDLQSLSACIQVNYQ